MTDTPPSMASADIPAAEGNPPLDGAGFRAAPRPALRAPRAWSFPAGEEHRLGNGMRVVVHHLPGQKVVSATLVLDLPLSVEPREREGVATLCCRCLDEGTQDHPGAAFVRALESQGAGFGVELGQAGVELTLDVPAGRLDGALQLFAEAVRRPSLTDEDVQRHQRLRLAEIEQLRANSAQTAATTFRARLFDPEFRAARMAGGEPDTVGTVTPDGVRAFHATWFDAGRATLVIGGDFDADPLPGLEAAFGDWPAGTASRASHQQPRPAAPSAVVVDRPGSVQADVRLGGFGIDRHDPRWTDLVVAAYAMGGAFGSRLNTRLREERGYSYGVSMLLRPMRSGGTFAVQGSFRTEVTAAALSEARELLDLAEAPFTGTEVDEARTFFAGVSPLRYATADGVVDQRAAQLLADLPDNYVDLHLAALGRVTPDSATAAYTDLVHVPDLTLVVVGDADALADPLREAGFPDLEIVTGEAG